MSVVMHNEVNHQCKFIGQGLNHKPQTINYRINVTVPLRKMGFPK
jgi:hypothetical protein